MPKRDFFKVIYIRSRLLNRMSESGTGYTKSVDLELIEISLCCSPWKKREIESNRAVRLKLMKQAVRGEVQATTIECQKSTRKKQKARAASTQTRNYYSGLYTFLGSSQRSIAFSAAHRKTISQSHIARVLFPSVFAIIDFFGPKIDAKITKLTLVLHIPSGRMPVDGKIEGACKSCPKMPTSNH